MKPNVSDALTISLAALVAFASIFEYSLTFDESS